MKSYEYIHVHFVASQAWAAALKNSKSLNGFTGFKKLLKILLSLQVVKKRHKVETLGF